MNSNFWNGFEKKALNLQSITNAGKWIAGHGKNIADAANAGFVRKNIGAGLQRVGNTITKHPVRTGMIGTGVAGLGGGMLLGSRRNDQNVNVYK